MNGFISLVSTYCICDLLSQGGIQLFLATSFCHESEDINKNI